MYGCSQETTRKTVSYFNNGLGNLNVMLHPPSQDIYQRSSAGVNEQFPLYFLLNLSLISLCVSFFLCFSGGIPWSNVYGKNNLVFIIFYFLIWYKRIADIYLSWASKLRREILTAKRNINCVNLPTTLQQNTFSNRIEEVMGLQLASRGTMTI